MKIKLLFVSIFLINQAIAAEVEIAGSMSGQADVDSSGGLNYSIPISLPNSLHSFIPNLSLDYSGHKQEGSLGVGWSITGLSVISRCQGVDNEVARKKTTTEIVNYEMSLLGANAKAFEFSDFCLDGKRLILTNGQTVAQPEFRLENDDFSRVTLKTNQSGSVEKFVVTQKNGVIREYEKIITINEKNSSGQYVDKISGGSLPYIWGLTKQSDIQGNYWTVEYLDLKKTDILYPKYIKYTGNSNGLKPYNLVTFDYVDRTEYEKKVSYFDGSTIILDKKLSKISLSVNGEVKNEYNLNYEEVGVKENKQISRVRLKDVNFCSIQTNEKSCVKPSEFTWSSYDKSNISEPVLSSAMSLSDGDVRKFIRLNSKKNSREQNLFVLMKNSNTNILVKIYQIINGLSSSKRELNLTHDSFNKFVEWQPIVKDVDNDEIDDLIVYGRDKDNNISLLEFISFFDSEGNRQFKFYKEIANIYQVDMPLSQHLVIDGDSDGIDDFLFTYNDIINNKLSFYVLKVDIAGNKSELFRSSVSWDSLRYINNIRSPNYPARLVIGHFNSNEVLTGLIVHNNSNGSGEERICPFSIIGKNTYLNNDSQSCNSTVIYTKENNIGTKWVHNEVVVVDYNQDGYDDLVRVNVVRDGVNAVNSESTKFWDELVPILSKGDGTFDVKNLIKTEPFFINTLDWTSLWVGKWAESSAFFGDYNQDGLLDYYRYADQGEKIYFVGFIQEPDNKFKSYNYLLDQWSYASDPNKIKLYTSLGVPLKLNLDSKDSGSFKLNFFAEPNLDYNSDGNPTLAFNVYATKSATGYLYSFKANIEPQSARAEPKDLLTLVSHGDSNKTGISYSNIFTTTELLNKNTFPIRSFTKPMLVVNTLNYGWGEGNISEINEFLYSSPKIDVKNGRNLGFESITQIKQGQQNLKVETTYNQNYPYIGMQKAIVTKAALNGASGGFDTLVSKMTVADADFVSDSAYPTTKVKFPRIKKSTVENYELGTLVSKTVTANNYENVFGNLTDSTVTTSSADGTSVFTTTVKPTYGTADKTNWIPGLIKDR
ncbi:FG-GAP repeat domain-containing protein, partial [Acinetobacter pittii]|uniref:FG-GAP repeat domain-containing protein n=1 Tax=Acinetobacter pittii TaxID=48296 RepID=UPI0032611CC2